MLADWRLEKYPNAMNIIDGNVCASNLNNQCFANIKCL